MKRIGAKNQPVFRIVVADGRSPRDGKCIEELGTYQPRNKGQNFTLDLERATGRLAKQSIDRGPFGDWWRAGVAKVKLVGE